jgi:hypothetical protein
LTRDDEAKSNEEVKRTSTPLSTCLFLINSAFQATTTTATTTATTTSGRISTIFSIKFLTRVRGANTKINHRIVVICEAFERTHFDVNVIN